MPAILPTKKNCVRAKASEVANRKRLNLKGIYYFFEFPKIFLLPLYFRTAFRLYYYRSRLIRRLLNRWIWTRKPYPPSNFWGKFHRPSNPRFQSADLIRKTEFSPACEK